MNKIFTLVLMLAVGVAAASAVTVDRNARKVKDNRVELESKAELQTLSAAADPEYKDLGTGLFTEAMLTEWYNFAPITYEVKIQQRADGSAHYRVLAPYGQAFADAMKEVNKIALGDTEYDKAGTCYLDLDATDPEAVYFSKTFIGADWGDGPIYIGIPTSGNVTFKDGIFSSTPRGVAVGDNTGAVAMNVSGKFRIVLPGVTPTDYTLLLTPESQCLTTRTFKANLSAGNDVAKVYYGIFADFQEDEMLQAIGAVLTAKHEFSLRGNFQYEMSDEANKETLVFVAVDADDEQVAYAWTTYYFIDDAPDQWVTIGTGDFTDPFLPALLNCESETLKVEIQAHRTRTGYLRLKNPYQTSKYAQSDYYHGFPKSNHNHYIYINGEDPEIIYLEESPICFDFGYGLCRVTSATKYFVDAGFDIQDCKDLEYGGVVENGVLTFPNEEALNFSMLGFDNGDWYYTDTEKANFRLTLPAGYDFAGVKDVVADGSADAPAEYYDLSGVRLDGRPSASGLYICRRGTAVTKVVVK